MRLWGLSMLDSGLDAGYKLDFVMVDVEACTGGCEARNLLA